MQLTRQADYAIRAVLYLATSPLANVQEIAEAQGVPKEFLAKILQTLSRKGIVITLRGVGGGVSLARPPEKISVLDVLEAIEGPPVINRCLITPNECRREYYCSVHEELLDLRELVADKLSEINFARLARREAINLKQKRRSRTAS